MTVYQTVSARAATIDQAATLTDELVVTSRYGRLADLHVISAVLHTESTMTFDDVGEHYHVHLPLSGYLVSRHRGQELLASRRAAAVYQPGDGTFHGRWQAGSRTLAVSLTRERVASALAGLLGEAPRADVRFEAALPTTGARVRSWFDMLEHTSRQLAEPGSFVAHPSVAGPLAESIATGLLLTARHSYSEALARPAPRARPYALTTAVDLMENDPAAPWTVTELATRCGVSTRTLQDGFRRHLDISPLGYLRTVRLRRAHDELRAADPYGDSVAAIARRWGFRHPGRFAAAHEAAYGQSPSYTLRAVR